MKNKTTLNKSLHKRITAIISSALSLVLLFTGCASPSPDSVSTQITTDAQTTNTTKTPNEEPLPTLSYDELLEMLNSIIAEKDFCDDANALIMGTFEHIYKNYNSWDGKYRDLPSVDRFIVDNFLTPLKNLQRFLFFYQDSEEAQKYIEEGCPSGYTEVLDDGGLGIFIIAAPSNTSSETYLQNDRQTLLHELTHCNQGTDTKLRYETEEYEKYEDSICAFSIEGGSTFTHRFAIEYSEYRGGGECVQAKDKLHEIWYSNIDGLGYITDLNMYTKYMYLVGYDVMYKWLKDEISFQDIADIISQKYGNDTGKKFLEKSLKMSEQVILNGDWNSDKAYNLAVETEWAFLDCIYSEINNASSLQELQKTERLYREYIISGLPEAIVLDFPNATQSKNITDITDTLFDTEYIDNLIEKKKAAFA